MNKYLLKYIVEFNKNYINEKILTDVYNISYEKKL